MKKSNVKILIGYHKPCFVFKSEVYTPIFMGVNALEEKTKDGKINCNAQKLLQQGFLLDNTYENISNLNRYFCELTALYWAWKNYDKIGNPNFIGFMHYRRHLSFIQDFDNKKRISACVQLRDMKSLYNKHQITSEIISKIFNDYDIILPEPSEYNGTVFEQYKNVVTKVPYEGSIEMFEQVINMVKTKYPEYSNATDEYINGKTHYWYNCFVMPKSMFFECSNFIFDILFQIHNSTDYSKFSIGKRRSVAYIAERLLGIFITYKILNEGKKILTRPLVKFKYTDKYSYSMADEILIVLKKFLKYNKAVR